MKLLSYETIEGQEGSYNDLIKQLVRKMRVYSNTPSDQTEMLKDELISLQAKIQDLDTQFGREYRDYLSDILDELEKESEIEELLMDELKRTASVLIPELDGSNFNIENFSFDFANHRGINIIEFYGYESEKQLDSKAKIFRDILRSLAYKYEVIFIESPNN